jgi:hypothetical protein
MNPPPTTINESVDDVLPEAALADLREVDREYEILALALNRLHENLHAPTPVKMGILRRLMANVQVARGLVQGVLLRRRMTPEEGEGMRVLTQAIDDDFNLFRTLHQPDVPPLAPFPEQPVPRRQPSGSI